MSQNSGNKLGSSSKPPCRLKLIAFEELLNFFRKSIKKFNMKKIDPLKSYNSKKKKNLTPSTFTQMHWLMKSS